MADPDRQGPPSSGGFRPIRRLGDALERQRRLRPSQQRRLLRAVRFGGERDPHRGGAARSGLEPDHRPGRGKQLPFLRQPHLSGAGGSRRRGRAPRPLLGALPPRGVQSRG